MRVADDDPADTGAHPDGAATGRPTVAMAGARSRWRSGDRLPAPPRGRRAGLIATGLLLAIGGAAAAGALAARLDDREPVLIAARDIAAGRQITQGDLAITPVAAGDVPLVPAGRASEVVGSYASTTIPAGRLLDAAMVTATSPLRTGQAEVGLVVNPGRAPAGGLAAGDRVSIVRVATAAGTVVAQDALVLRVDEGSTPGDIIGGPFEGGAGPLLVTVVVSEGEAPAVAAVGVDGAFSLIVVERAG